MTKQFLNTYQYYSDFHFEYVNDFWTFLARSKIQKHFGPRH